MEIERREDADADDDDDGEPLVATVDATEGIPTRRARDLARRLWYLGWFGLPLAWVYNAWMFWPHIAPDPPDASDVGLTAGVGDDDADDDDGGGGGVPERTDAAGSGGGQVRGVVDARGEDRRVGGGGVGGDVPARGRAGGGGDAVEQVEHHGAAAVGVAAAANPVERSHAVA